MRDTNSFTIEIKIITIIGICLMALFVFSFHAFAIIDVRLNTPLQVQVTPSQNWLNEQTRNNLIATYGILLVNSCIDAEPWCKDISNYEGGFAVAACLKFVQLDLAQGTMKGCQEPCASGYIRVPDGQCLTPEIGCNREFGQNSHFIKYDSSGVPQCGSWDLKCQNDYGSNSVWTGKLSNNGKAICGCKQGYVANSNGTNSCIISTPMPTPTKTNDQICQDSFGLNVGWDGSKNSAGGLICDCKTGYVWNDERTACIIATPTPTQSITNVTPKPIITPSQSPKSTIKNEGKVPEQATIANGNKEPLKNPSENKGLFPKLWSWFKGLFNSNH